MLNFNSFDEGAGALMKGAEENRSKRLLDSPMDPGRRLVTRGCR